MTAPRPVTILHELIAGRLTASEAARQLLAISGEMAGGLALDPTGLSPDAAARLEQLMPAIQWEMARQLVPGQVPDVAYDSPEYHAWLARMPTPRPGPAGVARFLPPDPPAPESP